MAQRTLYEMLGIENSRVQPADSGALEVYDLFCGAGGFTCGAEAAGCRVAFACDLSEEALETHRRNHPNATHMQCELPGAKLPLPTDGRAYHLHGSPPCQKFSQINRKGRKEGDKDHATKMVEWYIDFALSSTATSWSMEQVTHVDVLAVVERKRLANPSRLAYAVFHFEELGVPQTRARVIAGSPPLIAKLLRAREEQPRRCVSDVIPNPRGTHVRGGSTGVGQKRKRHAGPSEAKYTYKRAGWNDRCRPIAEPAFTVVGRHAHTWVIPSGTEGWHSVMTPRELGLLQTFPEDYKWPLNKFQAYLQIGNAVPPLVAELMLRRPQPTCVMDLQEGLRCSSPSLR